MGGGHKRRQNRKSQFVLAFLRLACGEQSVKLRNLSPGGAMIEGVTDISRGTAVSLYIGGIGQVDGFVAWTLEDRCGVAFSSPVEPKDVHSPTIEADMAQAMKRRAGP